MIPLRNTELMYADIEICKANKKDKLYILLMLDILFMFYILSNTGVTRGLFAVFWNKNLEILSPRFVLILSKFVPFPPAVPSSIVFLIIILT